MSFARKIFLVFLIILFLGTFYYNFWQFKYKDINEQHTNRVKVVFFLFFIFILAMCYALIEIEIEGKHGWAIQLPTWVYKPDWLVNLLGGKYPTGYHTILIGLFLPIFFHLPIFFTTWNLYKELIVIGAFFLFMVVEDFMWFVINPEYGIRKFNPKNKKIWWHKNWFGPLPDGYVEGLLVSFICLSVGLPYL